MPKSHALPLAALLSWQTRSNCPCLCQCSNPCIVTRAGHALHFAEAALRRVGEPRSGPRFDAAAMFPFSREVGLRGSCHRAVCCLTRECGIPVKALLLSFCGTSYGLLLFPCGLQAIFMYCSGPEAFCGPQQSPLLLMPIVPEASDGYLAWALVCILQVLVTDNFPGWETLHSSALVVPPLGWNCLINSRPYPSHGCQCHFCSSGCCRAGQPHTIHRCRRHRNW